LLRTGYNTGEAMARRAFQVPRRPWGAAALPRWGGLAAVLGLAVTLARGAEGLGL